MARGLILLAHGNPDCQAIYSSVLIHSGYAVQVVDTVDDALRRVAAGGFDVVIADLYLETVDQTDECLVRQLRLSSFGSHLPTVVLTAWIAESHRQFAHQVGADRFLAMPVTPRQVVAAIEELLAHGDAPKLPPSPVWDHRHRPTANGF